MLFRRLMLEQLTSAQRAGQLQFFAALEPLRETKAFDAVLRALKKRKWYIDHYGLFDDHIQPLIADCFVPDRSRSPLGQRAAEELVHIKSP